MHIVNGSLNFYAMCFEAIWVYVAAATMLVLRGLKLRFKIQG